MDNAGSKLKKEQANASLRNYLDESDSSSMHDSDLDLWCFGWKKTKYKKHSKPNNEAKTSSKYDANKSMKLESKDEHAKIEQKKVERQKAENNLSQPKPIDFKSKEDIKNDAENETKKRKSLISRISFKKETKSNESSAYQSSDTFYENKNETQMKKENLTNLSENSKKADQGGKKDDGKIPTSLSDIEQTSKKQRRTLGSLFSLKRMSRSKESTENNCSDVCKQDDVKREAKKTQDNVSSDTDEGKTKRRSLGSYLTFKRDSQNMTSQENTEKSRTKRSLSSLFSLKRLSRSNENSSTGGDSKTRSTLLSRLSLKKDTTKIKIESAESKETSRVEQQRHTTELTKPVNTLEPIVEVPLTKSNTIEENKSFGVIAESYNLKKTQLPVQTQCSDRSSVEESSSIIKVENLSKVTIKQQKPFGLLSDEEQLTELAKNQTTNSPPIPPSQQPLLTTIKQERFSEPLETETKTIYIDQTYLKQEPSDFSTDMISIKKEEFTYELIEDPNRPIRQEKKDSFILPVKKEEELESTTSIANVKPSTSSKVNKNIQTNVMDSEGDSPQRACDPPFERSFGTQTDPYRFDFYFDSSEKMLPMEKNSTSKHVQTDCVCNNDSSIERMNIRERERAVRTGSRKENKAVQTDICICNYVSTSDEDYDYDD